ncbi:MAG: hypothetical protein KA144_00435 [Xanthomonadaceae bacterium]|nr:hypothetical protein [Xanthomonadaceae bacterium]
MTRRADDDAPQRSLPERDVYAPPQHSVVSAAPPLSRRRRIVAIVFAIATALAIANMVRISLDPRQYFRYRGGDFAGWAWEPLGVAIVAALMAIEAALAYWALVGRRPRSAGWRFIAGLAVLLPWSLLSMIASMHMPGYVLFHHLWVWLLTFVLLIASAGVALRAIYRFARSRRQSDAG